MQKRETIEMQKQKINTNFKQKPRAIEFNQKMPY